MNKFKLNELPAWRAAELLASRELSATDLMRACLDRALERDAAVCAFAHLDPDAALAQARSLDAGPIRGPLHGLPLGVKDLFDTADMPTSYGSPIYAGHRPKADAASVALCREAGALVLGKTVTTEFAYFQPGPTRNPLNLAHTPGGSSSGSAAAVADHMLPLALGTQTAGSVIRPAAYCGVVGYKPTIGRVSRAGVKSLSESLDTVGGFGRCVRDVSMLGAVLTSDSRLSRTPQVEAPRIGVCRGHGPTRTHNAHWSRLFRPCRQLSLPLPTLICWTIFPIWWHCKRPSCILRCPARSAMNASGIATASVNNCGYCSTKVLQSLARSTARTSPGQLLPNEAWMRCLTVLTC